MKEVGIEKDSKDPTLHPIFLTSGAVKLQNAIRKLILFQPITAVVGILDETVDFFKNLWPWIFPLGNAQPQMGQMVQEISLSLFFSF